MSIDAVIFDWGGTLTRWHDVDFHAESLALARAVVDAGEDDHAVNAQKLHAAGDVVWGRSRDHQQSATVADLFTEAGSTTTRSCSTPTTSSGCRTPRPTPRSDRSGEALRADGLKVGVLSNTIWPRDVARGLLPARRRRPPDRR